MVNHSWMLAVIQKYRTKEIASWEITVFFFSSEPTDVQKQPIPDVLQIGVLKNFAIFTGKHLCWTPF